MTRSYNTVTRDSVSSGKQYGFINDQTIMPKTFQTGARFGRNRDVKMSAARGGQDTLVSPVESATTPDQG